MTKSYLTINNGEQISFNGVPSVKIEDESKADLIPVGYFDPNVDHYIVVESSSGLNGFVCIILRGVPSPGGLVWIRGFGGYYWGLVYIYSGGYAWTGITGGQHYRPGIFGVRRVCEKPNASLVFKLSLNDREIYRRPWTSNDSYTLQVDNPCPAGYHQLGDRCVWENVDSDGNPLPSDDDNDPNTPKGCPTGYFRFFNRCILRPGWKPGKKPGDPPIPPGPIDWNPFDDIRRPDREDKCPPGYEPSISANGQKICRRKCKPGEYRAKNGSCCCAGIPSLVHDLRSLSYEIKSIKRTY